MPKESRKNPYSLEKILYMYWRFIVENRDNIWWNLMHLKKCVMELLVRAFKNRNKWTPAYKDYWNTSIYLKNNRPHIKVPLIFWFLIMTFNCVYHKLWVKLLCIYIGNNFGYIGQTHSQNVCGCLTLNKILIKLISLIICSINNNLSNTWSAPPPEIERRVLYIVHLII